ncbi:MAG: phage replisome organizer N-terminal domain-containing protein [Clostridia bacterium]|nr:phage replisome organizer N-terminal domain-containing protein [Clostridia bacterium]
MADVKWIKVTTDIFDDEKILLIESLPEADSIIVIWFKLLCLAGKTNNGGVFMLNDRIAYTDAMLATIFRRKETTVRLALETFERFGMIEIVDNVVTIPNWGKHQNLDGLERAREKTRQRVARFRERQKQIAEKDGSERVTHEVTSGSNVSETFGNADRKRIRIREEEKENKEGGEISGDVSDVVELFHTICKSFPRVVRLSDPRKRAIRARMKAYSMEDFRKLFEAAEASPFLKGENDRGWRATFDWLMNEQNMTKVLEGAYADTGRRKRANRFANFEERPGDDIAELERQLRGKEVRR